MESNDLNGMMPYGTATRKPKRQCSAPSPYPSGRFLRPLRKPRSTSSSSKGLKLVHGFPTYKETNNAWGLLYKTGGNVFTLSRNLDKSLFPGQTPGYVIGTDDTCDIKIDSFRDAPKRHALIHSSPRIVDKKHLFAVFIQDQSSSSTDGVWVNHLNIGKNVVELNSNDVIHFRDPLIFAKAKTNPCYIFIKPRKSGADFTSFGQLYHRIKNIGTGSFGIVYLAICKTTGKRVAIKEVPLSKKTDAIETKKRISLLREISVCMAFPVHPCIIKVNKVFEENGHMYIVMEYGPNGDLFTHVSEADSTDFSPASEVFSLFMSELEVKIVFDQIAHAISYLHGQDIVHRDIKMENVIMCDREQLTAKLCDFGLCTFLKQGETLYTNCGTIMYAAPELLNSSPDDRKGYGMEVDIWSLGVLLYSALTNSTPFTQMDKENEEEKKKLRALIVKGEFTFDHPAWDGISDQAKDLISHMMEVNVSERYTISQVLSHPWLENIENEETREKGVTRNPDLVKYLAERS